MKDTRPLSISILGMPYKIFWVSTEDASVENSGVDVSLDNVGEGEVIGIEIEEKTETEGYICFFDQSITVDDDYPDYSKKSTLLHEVLHGCLHTIGKDDDEDLVIGLSYVLLDTLRRNPEFVNYLLEGA